MSTRRKSMCHTVAELNVAEDFSNLDDLEKELLLKRDFNFFDISYRIVGGGKVNGRYYKWKKALLALNMLKKSYITGYEHGTDDKNVKH